jgi:uncharacterized delta-60 repeat protein
MASSTSTFAAGGGKIITDFGGSSIDICFGMTLQADGKILLSGSSNGDCVLSRYNSDGSLDSSFGNGGTVTSLFAGNDFGGLVTVQSDGKILQGGSSNGDFVLTRYNANGTLDTSFSDDGKVMTNIGGDGIGCSVTELLNGKILVAGTSDSNNNGNISLVRYNIDGTLDTSFSLDGIVTTDLGHDEQGANMVVQDDGKILVTASTWLSEGNSNFILVRYNVNGSLDSSFSGDGIVTTDIYGRDESWSLALQADGKILQAGSSNGDFVLVRFNTDGRLDGSFSGDGIIITDFGNNESGWAVTVQQDGKILVAGFTFTGGQGPFFMQSNRTIHLIDGVNSDFALVRYNTDGSLDTSFGNGGKVTTDFGGTDFATGVAVLSDGKIVVSGTSNGDFALARYNPDGSLDTSANTLGTTGNDTFHSLPGNETFDGLAGIDSVIFSGHQSDYTITLAGTGFALKDNVGTDGTDTVVHVEKLQFSDHTLTIAPTPNETLLESYRIYKAAFDRAPDYGGLGFWYHSMNAGESLTNVAAGFINSNEFKAMYGDNPTDSTFVNLLYQHVLGRSLDQGGYNFWMNDLHVETRAQVLAHFSESAENIANLVGVIANGIIYEAYAG